MQSLVLINSSFQAMCAIEYLLRNGNVQKSVFVTEMAPDTIPYEQIRRLLLAFNIHSCLYVPIEYSGTLEHRIASYGEFYQTYILPNEFDIVILGDVRKQWMQDFASSVNSGNTVMVDDGGAVIAVINHILIPQNMTIPSRSQVVASSERQQLAVRLKQGYGMTCQQTNLELFSVFHKECASHICANDFSNVLKHFNPKAKFEQTEEIHFIGAPLVELKLLTKEQYLECIFRSSKVLASKHKKVYFKHRYETHSDKLTEIEELGFEIRSSEVNYEVNLICSERIPQTVISVLSTSLFNVKAIFADMIDAYFCPLDKNIVDQYKDTNWMVVDYTLKQHWTYIFDRFPAYGVDPILS